MNGICMSKAARLCRLDREITPVCVGKLFVDGKLGTRTRAGELGRFL